MILASGIATKRGLTNKHLPQLRGKIASERKVFHHHCREAAAQNIGVARRDEILRQAEIVQEESDAFQSGGFDAAHGKKNVVQAAEAIVRNHDHRQLQARREIAGKILLGDRHNPAAHTFDHDKIDPLAQPNESIG